jgi:hypothetical protein
LTKSGISILHKYYSAILQTGKTFFDNKAGGWRPAFWSKDGAVRIWLARHPPGGFLTAEALRYRNFFIQIHVLHGVNQLDPVGHGTLERLAPHDHPHAAGALVDYRGLDRILQIVLP